MEEKQSCGLNSKSDVEKAWTEIGEKVRSTPSMVFSVIGDSDSFVPRPWSKSVFQTALIEAAKSAGDTWILYRGYDYGVSSIVRSAYRKYGDMEFRAKSRDVLMDDMERHVKLISLAGKSTISTEPTEAECSIEPTDKTSFLLDFEEYVSKQEVPFLSQTIDLKFPIPIVILACEGDITTIEHIARALERKIPVIIIKGSGKAADLILDYTENKTLLRKKASVLFGIQFDENTFQSLTERLEDITKASDLVFVFDVNCDDPLMLANIAGEAIVSCWATEKILRNKNNDASMKSQPATHKDKTLYLPQSNGSVHIGTTVSVVQLRKSNAVMPQDEEIERLFSQHRESRAYVLDTKYSSPTSLPLYFYFEYQFLQELGKLKEYGHMLLFEALIANRCDYVRVLLDQGVRFRLWNLSELYEQTVSCKDCHFEKDDCLHIQWLLKQIEERKAEELCFTHRRITRKIQEKEIITERNKEIKDLKEDLNTFIKDDKTQKEISESAKGLCREILGYKDMEQNSSCVKISDILLWAIFANRKEIAEICWLRTTNQLLKGLVCAAVLRKLSRKADNVKEQNLSTEFADHAKMFEDRCLALMDGMYDEDNKNAIDLMDDEANVWGMKSSPLTFAHENFMYDVVAHTCSQKNMNKQWYNNLAPDLKPFLKSVFWKPRMFFTAPLTKYMFNYFMFMFMLVMYSAFVLTHIGSEIDSLDTENFFEYYVYFWGAGDLIEELISCFGCLESRGRSHRGYYSRLKRYLYDFWNVVDILSYAFLITALFVHVYHPSADFTVARRIFSLSLLVMYLRFLEVFLVDRRMGPTLLMIKEMLKDLLRFLVLVVFVVLGVGIYYHANLWPDHPTIWNGDLHNWRIWKIIYYPYWQLYGETNNNLLQGELKDCTNDTSIWKTDLSKERCPKEDWTVSAVAALYMLFSNLLLVNLVIAMFSYTFEKVQNNAEKLWKFHRYTVINDYEWRIPSPINFLFLPYRLCCCPGRKVACKDKLRGEDISNCTNITSVWEADTSIDRCPQQDWTVLAISAFYMLFSNLLLVNLVIAMFMNSETKQVTILFVKKKSVHKKERDQKRWNEFQSRHVSAMELPINSIESQAEFLFAINSLSTKPLGDQQRKNTILTDKVRNFKKTIESQQEQLTSLESKLSAALKKNKDEKERKKIFVDDLEDKLNDARTKNKALEKKIGQMDTEIFELREALRSVSNRLVAKER
ncbi:transient receptor potential cation channel subfamily M member 8-like [Saccostrea echinata]|uniref:transient receptor potential cation channel subfamily M member 8-like n=1 Tax=Saccostrea echinata TaxID=191078 RepID=UPI002A81A9EE|nr:transient receptor potential cation channel subfamily M member 8-like [Saccostrea echinata]